MANLPAHLKSLIIRRSLVGLVVVLALAGLLTANGHALAGSNVWTWDGIGGSVETILSNPVDPSTVYALGDNRHLYRTTDAGHTWTQLPDPPHAGTLLHLRLALDDTNVLYLWGYDSGAFSYRSTDGGDTWQALSMAGEVAVSPADWREIYLSSGASLYTSADGGDTWGKVSDFPSACSSPYDLFIAPSAPQTIVTVVSPPLSMDFSLCRTTDGGQTWSPLAITSPAIHAVVFDPKNSDTIYLASVGGGWKSTDGGGTWQPISNGLNNPAQFVVDPDNTQVIHAADYNLTGGVFESLDGGATWTQINAGIQGLSVRTIAIGSRDPLKIYAGVMYSGLWEFTRTGLRDYGITVNDGALFTNQTAVTLTLTAPAGTTQMMVSNDGGFSGAAWQPFTGTQPWAIDAYGTYVLPRTVYAKFKTSGQVSGQYQDDIILDPNPPTGTVQITDVVPISATPALALPAQPLSVVRLATDTLTYTVYLPLAGRNFRPGYRLVGLALSASDDASGVGGVMIGNDAAFTGSEWQPYVRKMNWYVPDKATTTLTTTVYVKYRDRAGNESQVYSAVTAAP